MRGRGRGQSPGYDARGAQVAAPVMERAATPVMLGNTETTPSQMASPLKYIAHAFFCSLATVIYDYTPVGSMQSEDT
jgi:hypothetical protein